MIVQEALPQFKTFLKPARLPHRAFARVLRCVAAFCLHFGRRSAVQAAGGVRSQPRHRAQIGRFLARNHLRNRQLLQAVTAALLRHDSTPGRFVFLVDQTLCSQQGDKTENTYSRVDGGAVEGPSAFPERR